MKRVIIIIWAVIAIMFFGLGCFYWYQSNNKIPYFEVTPRPMQNKGKGYWMGADFDKPLRDFANDFNEYLKKQNKSNKYQNRFAATGCWISSGLCVISVLLNSFWFQRRFLQ